MNAVINCSCGVALVYDTEAAQVCCPVCSKVWYRTAPPLVSATGIEAQALPFALAGISPEMNDSMVGQIRDQIIAASPAKPTGIFLVFRDGKHSELPLDPTP